MERIARTLREVDRTIKPRPLTSPEEMEAWYRGHDQLQSLRGRDVVQLLAVSLERDPGADKCKAFVMGRPGVGKTTELNRLILMVRDQYEPVFFSLRDQLDPKRFTAFDVILLICILLTEETKRVTGKAPQGAIMMQLLDWYAEKNEALEKEVKTAIDAAGGFKTEDTWWDKVVGLFVSIKGSIAYSEHRKEEVVAYQLRRIQPLIDIANTLINNCDQLLKQKNGKEWLIIGDDIDKPGMDLERVQELFLVYGRSVFEGLQVNMVFNLPLALTFGGGAQQLPDLPKLTIYDVPVYKETRDQNEETIAFVEKILAARVDPSLFEDGQARRLIIASGANLRDLFSLILEASLEARARRVERIAAPDVDRVIANARVAFQARLGMSPFDPAELTPEVKVDRLMQLYRSKDTGAEVHDQVLGALVGANVVQAFNGKHWYGIHPLIIDALRRMGQVTDPKGGTI